MKSLFSLLLALIMIFALSACGETDAVQDITIPTQSAAFSPSAPAETPDFPASTPSEETAEEDAPILHSGLREDGTFSAGTLFIGDSLTYIFTGSYLRDNGLLGECKYMAKCGSQITAFFDSTILSAGNRMVARYSAEFEGMHFNDAAASLGERAAAIYIMWGTNFTPDASAQTYVDIVNFLLENCPNATIHLQTIPYGDVNYTEVNKRITDAYDHYAQIGKARVMLIDTFTAIGKHTVDGIHLDNEGNANWYNAIVQHASSNNLYE